MSPSSSACTAPKLFCACSSERIGAPPVRSAPSCAGLTCASVNPLEVELVDVLDRERVRRPQDHLRPLVRSQRDLVRAELAGLERLADLARDRALGQGG